MTDGSWQWFYSTLWMNTNKCTQVDVFETIRIHNLHLHTDHVCIHRQVHTCTFAPTDTCTCKQVHMCIRMHTHAHAHAHTHTHTLSLSLTRTLLNRHIFLRLLWFQIKSDYVKFNNKIQENKPTATTNKRNQTQGHLQKPHEEKPRIDTSSPSLRMLHLIRRPVRCELWLWWRSRSTIGLSLTTESLATGAQDERLSLINGNGPRVLSSWVWRMVLRLIPWPSSTSSHWRRAREGEPCISYYNLQLQHHSQWSLSSSLDSPRYLDHATENGHDSEDLIITSESQVPQTTMVLDHVDILLPVFDSDDQQQKHAWALELPRWFKTVVNKPLVKTPPPPPSHLTLTRIMNLTDLSPAFHLLHTQKNPSERSQINLSHMWLILTLTCFSKPVTYVTNSDFDLFLSAYEQPSQTKPP